MKYQNPIISGFNPDPSICRVGEDFYLVTSTFEFFPGVPIYHSKNLINWELINYCLTDDGQLPLQNVKPSGGIYHRLSDTMTEPFLWSPRIPQQAEIL